MAFDEIDNGTLLAMHDQAKSDVEEYKKMARAAINDLPDSDFAYVEPGGKKDGDGKTIPRSLRHFPIHDQAQAHARNALARLPQSDLSPAAKATARKKIVAACKKFGIEVSERSEKTKPEDEVQTMSDEKKEAVSDVAALVAELKAEFAKDTTSTAIGEKLDQAVKFAREEADKKAKELETKLAASTQALEEVTRRFTTQEAEIQRLVQSEREAKHQAEVKTVEADLQKFFYPPELEVIHKWGLLPNSGDKLYKFAEGEGETTRSLLEFAVELGKARPNDRCPGAETVETAKQAPKKQDTESDSVKLQLAAYEKTKAGQGVTGDDLKKAVELYKTAIVVGRD